MKYLSIFSLSFLLLNSCIKEECRINGGGYYVFEIPVTLSPAKDTFQVGDTITIISSFSDEVYERKTNKSYKLKNFRFFPELAVREISVSPADESALLNFDVVVDTASNFRKIVYSSGAVDYIGEYSYDSSGYYLAYKLIPRASGFYNLFHFSAIIKLGDTQDFEGKCRNLKSDVAINMNDGADNNIDMLKNSPNPHFNTWVLQKPDQRFHQGGSYCFYVK